MSADTPLPDFREGLGVGSSFTTTAARLAGLTGAVLGWRPAEFWAASRAVTPLSPVHPTVADLPGGDTLIGWTRRSRAGWHWGDGIDAPLGEEREAYRVAWLGTSAEVVEPAFVFTAAIRAAAVAAGASTVAFDIRQSGNTALSPPLRVSLPLT